MQLKKMELLKSRWWLVLCCMVCFVSMARAGRGVNEITLSMNSGTYDCATGKVTVSYHIVNRNEDGSTNYKTMYSINTGTVIGYGQTFDEGDVSFTGDYSPGDVITISAYGISNNAAEEVSFDYVINGSSIPPAPSVIASPQSVLCNGGSTGLYASPSAGGIIHWSNGQTGNMTTVNTPGNYFAYEVNSCGQGPNSNVVTITAINNMVGPEITSSNGTALCNGAYTTISVQSPTSGTYYWSNGQTGTSITVNTAGTYNVYVGNECGTSVYSNSIVVTTGGAPPAPSIATNQNTQLCDGATATLFAVSPQGAVTWSNGQTGNSITVSVAGSYSAYQTNGCGTSGYSNVVSFTTASTPAPPNITPTGPIILCDGSSTTLFSNANSIWSLNGTPINSGPNIVINAAGNYTATAANSCGTSGTSNTIIISTLNRPVAPTVTPPGSQLLCNGESAVLSSNGTNITWSNGATGNSMTTAIAGNYYSYSTNVCGNSPVSNTVVITSATCPTPSPGTSFYVCPGSLKTLDAGAGYDTYSWNTGQSTRTITVGPGNYSVTVTKNGCAATSATVTVGYYTVTIPVINPTGATTFCAGNFVTLVSSLGSAYLWNTGATGNSINVNSSGSYYVTVTDANGCQATSAATAITVNALPTATVAGSTTVCQNGTNPVVTFTGSGGVSPYTFYYKINGGSTLSVTTTSGNSVSVNAPTNIAGSFTYELVSVKESSSTACTNAANGSATVVVSGLPSANVSGNNTVCLNGSSPVITFNGSGGVAPYTFTYSVNGGASQTVTTTSGNSASISVPIGLAGTFSYALLSVNASNGCSNNASGNATVVVKPLPFATIAGSVTVCQNSSNPLITFTGSAGMAPYIFTYKINGGVNQTVTTNSGNSVTVEAPTGVAGSFVYSLVSVQESSGQVCANSVSGNATVVVNSLPVATISGNASVCQNGGARVITFAGNNGTAPYTFTYKVNGGADQMVTTTSGNSVTVNVPVTTPGTYAYSLVSVKESSITNCTGPANGSASVVVNPLPAAAVILAPNSHLCNGETGQLTISNWSEGFTYTWYRDGVVLTSTTAQTLDITLPGSYKVMVTSSDGCNATAFSNTIVITVGTISTPIITGYLKVCKDGKTKLVVSPSNENWAYEVYRWTDTPIGDSVFNGKNFSAFAGQYQVLVKREGCFDSAKVIVSANDTEFPAGRLTITPNKIPYGGKADLVADVTGAATYQWDLGDSHKAVTFSNKINQAFYTRADSVLVKVMAVSERNCATEFTASLKIGAMDSVKIPDHSWTGNLKDWNLFPMPFHNELKLSVILKRNETVRIDLFTALGQWVRSWQFSGKKGENLFQLDKLEGLASYVTYFITGFYNGEKHSDKIFKY